MHRALYREFRPQTFDELIGQDHIVRILKNQIKTGNTSHAYLFSGTRGTGKTTTARILAKALNCTGEGEKPCCQCENCRAIAEGSFVDVIEIDAASNNGVDSIRELTDSVMYAPSIGKCKVYIIDEVHMLSQGAFNALLKTLEEPPEYVVFILATTDPQKVPATILSRCLRLDFRRVSENDLVENMRHVCDARGIEAEQGALALIAVNADGSVRDSLSILEQCIVPGEPLKRDDVAEVLGTAGEGPLLELTDCVMNGDTSGALLRLNEIIKSGSDVKTFMKEWLDHFRNLLIAKYVENPADMLNMSGENAARVEEQARAISVPFLDEAVRQLTETISLTKWSRWPRIMLEMCIVKLCRPQETAGPAVPADPGMSAGAVPHGTLREQHVPRQNRTQRPVQQPRDAERAPRAPEPYAPPQPAPAPPVADPGPQGAGAPVHSAPDAPARRNPDASFSEADWERAVGTAASKKGLFIRLINRTHLERESGGVLYISCDDAATLSLIKGNGGSAVTEIIEQQTGRHYTIAAEEKKTEGAGSRPENSRLQQELNDFMGIDVKIR